MHLDMGLSPVQAARRREREREQRYARLQAQGQRPHWRGAEIVVAEHVWHPSLASTPPLPMQQEHSQYLHLHSTLVLQLLRASSRHLHRTLMQPNHCGKRMHSLHPSLQYITLHMHALHMGVRA